MSRTLRRHRAWWCPVHRGRIWSGSTGYWRCSDCERAGHVWQLVRDWHAWSRCGRGMRRRKRNNLRAWRHHNRVQVRKGLEPEPYSREWLD